MADNRSLRFGKNKEEPHACKKRKMVEKVVMVKMDTSDKRSKSEGPPPSDSWSWRKYGQKPIKGSPFPRGYYRCSTSKGCTAKKQVERCKTDASKIIVTYTSSHNHPIAKITKDSVLSSASVSEKLPETPELEEELEEEQNPIEKSDKSALSQFNVTQEENYLVKKEDVVYDSLEVICKEQPLPNEPNQVESSLVRLSGVDYMDTRSLYAEEQLLPNKQNQVEPRLVRLSGVGCMDTTSLYEDEQPLPNSDENDIYDELDELPTASCLTELMRNSFFDERILVEPF